ncbi:hypothetical protein BDR04DRAFT_992413, partial [Suillus decipiens]
PEGTIHSVSTLQNGGLIVELESKSLASWLNNPTGRNALESHLDTTVLFCQRHYLLILEYLPIHLQIEQENFLCHAENENNIPENSLASIKWIKPPSKCSAEQHKAFVQL